MKTKERLCKFLEAAGYYVVGKSENIFVYIETDNVEADVKIGLADTDWEIESIELYDNLLSMVSLSDIDYEIDRLKGEIEYFNDNTR